MLGPALTSKVLVTGATLDRLHDLHPEVAGVGSKGVDRLLERDFYLEAQAVDLDDR